MEELFPALIFMIIAIVSAVSNAKKAKDKKNAGPRPVSTAKPVKPAQPYAPFRPTPYQPSFTGAAPQVITPTVHTHITPDCEVHDAPGSLGFVSAEGKDPCHEDQLDYQRTVEEPKVPQGGLTLNWSGSSLVQAFVMQEILTRPGSRNPGCQRR